MIDRGRRHGYDRRVIDFPQPSPGDELRVSATLYRLYLDCPRAAQARLEGHYGPDSVRSFVGALTHRMIRRHLEDGPIPEAEFETACRMEIGAGLNQKMVSAGIRSASLLQPLIREVGDLYKRFSVFPGEGFAGAEVELEDEAAEGVSLVGKIDAVFAEGEGHVLIDWKSGSLGDPMAQLLFYALLWARTRSELPARVEAVSIATGERVETVPSTPDLTRLAGEISSFVSLMREAWTDGGALETRGGPWCRYCPILDSCTEGRAAVKILDGEAG